MSDDSVLIFVLGLGVTIVASVIKAVSQGVQKAQADYAEARDRSEAIDAEIRAKTERRALELAVEFPALSDHELAQLMHDELMNTRADRRWFAWATPETVGRMRRTLMVEIARRERSEKRSLPE